MLEDIQVTQVEEVVEEESEELGEDEASFTIHTETTYALAIQLNLPTESEPNFSTGKAEVINLTAVVDEKAGILTWVWIAITVSFAIHMFLLGRRQKS